MSYTFRVKPPFYTVAQTDTKLAAKLNKNNGVATGKLTVPTIDSSSGDNEAATRKYVDDDIAGAAASPGQLLRKTAKGFSGVKFAWTEAVSVSHPTSNMSNVLWAELNVQRGSGKWGKDQSRFYLKALPGVGTMFITFSFERTDDSTGYARCWLRLFVGGDIVH